MIGLFVYRHLNLPYWVHDLFVVICIIISTNPTELTIDIYDMYPYLILFCWLHDWYMMICIIISSNPSDFMIDSSWYVSYRRIICLTRAAAVHCFIPTPPLASTSTHTPSCRFPWMQVRWPPRTPHGRAQAACDCLVREVLLSGHCHDNVTVVLALLNDEDWCVGVGWGRAAGENDNRNQGVSIPLRTEMETVGLECKYGVEERPG